MASLRHLSGQNKWNAKQSSAPPVTPGAVCWRGTHVYQHFLSSRSWIDWSKISKGKGQHKFYWSYNVWSYKRVLCRFPLQTILGMQQLRHADQLTSARRTVGTNPRHSEKHVMGKELVSPQLPSTNELFITSIGSGWLGDNMFDPWKPMDVCLIPKHQGLLGISIPFSETKHHTQKKSKRDLNPCVCVRMRVRVRVGLCVCLRPTNGIGSNNLPSFCHWWNIIELFICATVTI
jgi:hypothetical protein